MRTAIIIGSGLSAAGVALALSRSSNVQITILDIGLQLEPDLRAVVDTLSTAGASEWEHSALRRISTNPVPSKHKGLPQKRAYGSDFPFRNGGQLDGLTPSHGTSSSLVSGAYGGFSTVWGAQLMPFTAANFRTWPIAFSDMAPHYRSVLAQIPFAGEQDDLQRLFPLIGSPTPLPAPSSRAMRSLEAYAIHRARLNAMGITMGRARLAMAATACVRCGLCMTGCPYSLIFSASQTIDELRRSKRVVYRDGLLALRVEEQEDNAVVIAKDMGSGKPYPFEADRVFVACGAIGTTRLVANSINLWDHEIAMAESQQFTLPMLSRRATRDPRSESQFTLSQFNMVMELDASGDRVSQLHFYTYDPAFIDALPAPIRAKRAGPLMSQLLRRLTVAIGYLPSSHSPQIRLRVRRAPSDDSLPPLELTTAQPTWLRNSMLRHVLVKLLRAGRFLDLYPVIPKLMLAAGGKSYHWGGSFPHSADPRGPLTTDRVGRIPKWRRIHLVDGSVFPEVPASTYGLTLMANAHRIAAEAMELPE